MIPRGKLWECYNFSRKDIEVFVKPRAQAWAVPQLYNKNVTRWRMHTKIRFFWCYFILDKLLLVSYCKPSKHDSGKFCETGALQLRIHALFLFSRESTSTSVTSAQVSTVTVMDIHLYMFRQIAISSNFSQTVEKWLNQEKANCLNTSCSISISLLAIDGTIHSYETCLLFCCGINMRRAWYIHRIKNGGICLHIMKLLRVEQPTCKSFADIVQAM